MVPSLTGIFKFGIRADFFPSTDDAFEFESSFRSSRSCARGLEYGLLVWGLSCVTGVEKNRVGGFAIFVVGAGTGVSTSIGSSSCSSGIGGVVKASCCLNISVVFGAMDSFFDCEDALRTV